MTQELYRFDYRPYRRQFLQPLRTHHGLWETRQGILLRLSAGARVGYGEIAPLPQFGSETQTAALSFCRRLGSTVSVAQLAAIPASLPACRFALESARWELQQGTVLNKRTLVSPLGKGAPSPPSPGARGSGRSLGRGPGKGRESGRSSRSEAGEIRQPVIPDFPPADCCALLPSGAAALDQWQGPWANGHRSFKWKIGVQSLEQELAWGQELRSQLPPAAQLRLDANGGLSLAAAHTWLTWCDQVEIEFLEQPLPPDEPEQLRQLSQQYRTPIALDESVSSLADLEQWQQWDWTGVYVVKPAIAGSPGALLDWYHRHQPRLVLSTVFETPIGRGDIRRLAAGLYGGSPPLALGWGTPGFQDDWDQLTPAQVWQRLDSGGRWG